MKILLGSTRDRQFLATMQTLGWGRLMVDRVFTPEAGEPWALDNGLFAATKAGEVWDMFSFVAKLQQVAAGTAPLFACLPDRPQIGGGENTSEGSLFRSLLWWQTILKPSAFAPWRWLLAVQDGMTLDQVERCLPELQGFGGIFLGGSNGYKAATAAAWCDWAHARGLWFHYARAGTPGKIRHAREIGADSVDTTSPLWTRQLFADFVRTVTAESPQLEMFDWGLTAHLTVGARIGNLEVSGAPV